MIKAMKPFLPKICVDEYAYLVLLRLFDVVDDTVLVGKAILGVCFYFLTLCLVHVGMDEAASMNMHSTPLSFRFVILGNHEKS